MNKKQEIFAELKRGMNMLKDQGYEVAFISLQGSQNYNMDIYTDEYKSDIDCFACILPKFEDFVNNKQPISTTIVLDNNEHIGLKDVRLMFELFRKQNQQYLELLYTDYKILNKKYKEILKPIFFNNEWVSQINKKSLYNAIAGAVMNKKVALEHPYPTIKWKIDKYGYDGKQLHHIIRLSQFIHNLENGMSFKESLTYFEGLVEMLAMNAKKNKLPLDEARFYAESVMKKIDEVKDKYKDEPVKDDEEYVKKLYRIKTGLLQTYFKEQLLPKQEKPFVLNLDKYENVYAISDTHFGHKNILDFENRRYFMNVNNIEEHDKKLIENWNSVVTNNDAVLILGDFSFHKAKQTEEILKQLNGDKILIEGNHDMLYLQDKTFDRSLYKEITTYKEVKYKDYTLVLMHYPISVFKHQDKETNQYVHLFGHIHSRVYTIPIKSYNVGADVNNYTPINIDKAIEECLKNTGGVINSIKIRR